MAKKQSNRRRNAKCPECVKPFAGSRYLKQHMNSQHKNNNNNNDNNNDYGVQDRCDVCNKAISKSNMARHKMKCGAIKRREEARKEKKSFIFFLNFIIKIIMIYNKKIDIANLIGDEYEQRRHLYNEKNIIEDDENSSLLPAPQKEENNSPMPSEPEDNESNEGNNNDEEVIAIAKYFNKFKKEEINNNNKALRKYFAIKNTRINHNNIKILTKNNKIEMIRRINNNNNNNDLKYKDGASDLFLEYINQFAFTKISCRQVIRNATDDEEIIKKADQIINKKISDYPTDEEIKNKGEEIENWLAITRNNNIFYNENIEKFSLMAKNFFKKEINFINNLQCDYCFHFIFNKKRHLFQCKKYKNSFGENKGALVLNYLRICYPYMKPEVKSRVANYLEKKDLKYIYENTRGILKFGLLKRLEEEEKKKEEKKEKKKIIKKKSWVAQIIKEIDEEEKAEEEKNK